MSIVNLQEAARILGVSQRTVYNRVHKQTLVAYKDHRNRLAFKVSDLQADLKRLKPRRPRQKVAI